ncbi:MAG TPA: TlpA disulfide reductase family protein [Candidatus Limnocylindrales bacterium]|jgi:thiol-disulfide isomerase/thioredoxin
MRIPTFVGLLAGLLVGALVLGAIAMNLGSTNLEPPPASLALASSSPSPSVDPSPSATASASSTAAGSSPTPSASGPTAVPTPSIAVGLKVDQQAPGLRVARVGGGTVDLAALRGKPVWLAFTASWCPSCRDEMSLMDAAAAQYRSQLQIVAVDVREDAATAASLVAQTGFVATMGVDADGTAQQTFNALVLPMHYFIDRNGIIRYVLFGEGTIPGFATGLKSILPGVATFAP